MGSGCDTPGWTPRNCRAALLHEWNRRGPDRQDTWGSGDCGGVEALREQRRRNRKRRDISPVNMNERNHSTRRSIGIHDAEGVPNRARGFRKDVDRRNQLRPRLDAVAGLERLIERGNPVERHMQRLRGIEQLFGRGISRENDVAGFR